MRPTVKANFGTKVLVPLLVVMVLLMSATAWLVNGRLMQQFQSEAVRSLATADAVFRNSQRIRTKNLLLRFRNLPKEPRYRAAFQSGDLPTLRAQIQDLPADQGVDLALFTSASGGLLASSKRDPLVSINEFETNSWFAVQVALRGEEQGDTVRVGDRLFDIVSIPVFGTSEELTGALTFGTEVGESVAQEFSLVTHSQIVLLANGKAIASTIPTSDAQSQLAALWGEAIAGDNASPRSRAPNKIMLGEEHYFYSTGQFPSLSGDHTLGYLLLSSYDQPLRALQNTQHLLLLISALGILLGGAIVWFLVRKITQPLRELRSGAEAIARGDFSTRVAVTSGDECGELAVAFNRMTESLKFSREQLEKTVESLKATQAQLIQSEKLSGIGEFVAGVAHELNNPLTTVMGFSELLQRADTNPQNQRFLDMIHKSAVRCQKIVQNLLSFARRHPPERKLASVNSLVEGAVEFLQYQLRTSNIEVTTKLDPNLPQAMVDPHQVQQVFLNIINNARQAIEGHQPRGAIRITTETAGQHVRITFQDNGPGIPPEHLSKVFDPFFTTKETGKGTGLGLSLCYGIITEHGGTVTVRSKPGEGATFEILLALALANSAAEEKNLGTTASPSTAQRGSGRRILVIDDEDSILQMVRETLSQNGFQVDVARDGESALGRLRETAYDLALCDWKMPGLSGEQVYERVRAANPRLSERIIFITGDVVNDKTRKFLEDRKKVCLSKPFSLSEFSVAIDKALASG